MEKAFLTILEKAPGVAIAILILLVLFRAVPEVIKYILTYCLFKRMIDKGADYIDFFGGRAFITNDDAQSEIDNEGQNTATNTDDKVSERKIISFRSENLAGHGKRNRGD